MWLVVIVFISTCLLSPAAAQPTDNNPVFCLSYHSVSYSCNCHACECSTCYSCGCSAKAWGSCSYDSCNSCWCSPLCRCCRDDNCGSPCNCRATCCDTCSQVECANSVQVHATAIIPTRLSLIQIETNSAITVTGSNFVSTQSISCRLTRESDGHVFTVTGSFADSTHLTCPVQSLALTPATYVVTVSLDAISYTINDPPLTVTVYNCPFTTTTDHQCSGHGSCGIDGVCTCLPGFWGPGCENACPIGLDALICSGNAFVNETCNSDGTCQCREGSAGVACEIVCPGANVQTGDMSGACSASIRGACQPDGSCLCHSGYKGAACELNGTCTPGYPGCGCVSGWGPTCSNQCEPCEHGVCSPLDGKCFCDEGYFGSQCDQTCPGGAVNPCSGHLVTGMHSCTINGTCVCQYGWYGAACENACPGGASTPCSQRGKCLVEGSCSCDYGFAGGDCSFACPLGSSSSGSNLICSGHGECTIVHGSSGTADVATCTCQRGYYGSACDLSCSDCLSAGSTGWCDAVTGDCTCQYGYFGKTCNQTCPGGVLSPCSHHGLCNSAGHCDCLKGYFGDNCEQLCPSPTSSPSSPTSSPQPCSLHGSCTSNGTCICDPSYTGVDCSERYCPYDCYQHGRCVNGSCHCDGNWSGPYCSTMNTTSIIHGMVSFKVSSISVEERWPAFPLLLQRTNGSVGGITVYVSTTGVSALSDIDFVSLQNVAVTWNDGDSSDKSVSVSLIQDTLAEDDELFVVGLTMAVLGGAVIGSPSSVNVTILANSGGGGGSGGSTSGLDGVIVQITLRLNISLTSMPTGSPAQQQFLLSFTEDLASCLQVSTERVSILLLAAAGDAVGECYLTLQLLPPSSASSSSTFLNNALSSPGLANELLHAIANPSSCVYSRTSTRLVDLSYMPTVLTINPSSSSSSSSLSTTAIVVIVVVCSVVLLAMVGACVIAYRRRKQLTEWMLWKLAGMRFRPLHDATTAAEPDEDGLALEQTNYVVD